jgi:tubulin-specific chaperone A
MSNNQVEKDQEKAPVAKASIFRHGLRRTLFLWFLALSLIPLTGVSIFSYRSAHESLKKEAFSSLESVARLKSKHFADHFQRMLGDLEHEAMEEENSELLRDLGSAFKESGKPLGDFVKSFKWRIIVDEEANDLKNFCKMYGYHDLFLIDERGNILFTVAEEDDLATNLFNGKYSDTLFARVFKKILETGRATFSDFERYAPSNNDVAGFLVSVIVDEDGDKVGVMAAQIREDQYTPVMQDTTGFKKTQETYMVGTDLKMRSSFLIHAGEGDILGEPIATEQTRFWLEEHLKGEDVSHAHEEAAMVYDGPHGKQVLGVHKAIEIGGVPFAIIAEVEADEAFSAANRLRIIVVGVLGATGVLAVLIAFAVSRRIVVPVEGLSGWAKRVATGDLTYEEIATPDNEIGVMNESFRDVVKSFEEVTLVCGAVAAGDLTKSVEVRSEKDWLGKAVNKMIENLKEAKRDNERKISYLNNIPTPVFVIDEDFNIRFMNKVGASLVNRTVDEFIGKKCYELFNTRHCQTEKCRGAVAMKTHQVLTADTIADLPDGELPIRYSCAALKDDSGNTIGAIEYLVDITDEMKVIDLAEMISQGDYSVEIEKRSEEDRLGPALNRMTKTLREVTEENEKQDWLKTGRTELSDRTRGEQNLATLGRNIVTFLAEYLNAQIGAMYLTGDNNHLKLVGSYAFKKRKNLSNEFEIGEGLVGQAALEKESVILTNVPEDYIAVSSGLGEAVPRNIMVMPFLREGEVKGVLELGTFEEFSPMSLDFLNQVSENIAVTVHSAQGRQKVQQLLEKTQAQAEELESQQEELRQSNEELEGQTKSLKKSEARLQEQQEELRQTNEELEEQTQVLEEQKKDTQKKNVELEKAQRLVEEKAKDLEIASKYKSEFLANMSHELRTPLNSVLLLSKLLSGNKDKNLTPKQQDFAETIHSSGADLLNLINEVLDLSKVESGKMEIIVDKVALHSITASMERNFRPVAKEKGLNLNADVSVDLPPHVSTDRQRLEQILKNLFSNAFKFTEQGSVTLKISRPDDRIDLSKSGLDPAKVIAFSVSDTGQGIPKDKQRMIFEAFQQADGTTSRKFGGTGLGLSISRELAKLLGGELQLESEEGKGSTFTLYLPEELETRREQRAESKEQRTTAGAPDAMPHAPCPTRSEATDAQRATHKAGPDTGFIPDDRKEMQPEDKSILIIEDDPKFAKVVRDLSREKGFKVLVAEDGETGLHFADYYKPSAIILDIGLPQMDGWAVMSRLKESSETRHIPVHFISATDKSIEAMKMGAIGFLTKPVSMEGLNDVYAAIEEVVSKPVKDLLVVEDDEAQQKAIVELIANGDVKVTAVATGQEAYEQLASGHFDCVILDLGLPDMSGEDLLTKLRSNDDIPYVPIIIYTGRELSAEEKTVLDEYSKKILVKGVQSPETLLDETNLFLHRVQANLPEKQRRMLEMIHDKESIMRDKKILLADDDMRNVFALTSVLEEKGVVVLVAKNGNEALECLDKNPDIALVLMDIMMPEMDGYETTRKIRKKKKFKNLPVIALTAKAMKGDRAKCVEAGANDYLAKPVDTDKLLSMLRVWLY